MFSHYCPSCRGSIYEGECTGESGIYGSQDIPDLCEPCWIAEDAEIEEAGTNDLPHILNDYRQNNKRMNR